MMTMTLSDEEEDDESSNDLDDDEVGDESSNRPGINDSPACPNKEREKRSGSNVGNVARGCNSPPPPSPRARPRHPPMGERRGADQTLPLSRMGVSVHLEKELIQRRGGKKGKKGGGILHLPPLMAILSDVLQVQTPLVPMNLPNCFLKMSDLKPFQ
jgi:hypothetical protein